METVLQVKGLSKQYKKGIYASHNVTFDVGKGEIFALIGPICWWRISRISSSRS